jgi:hypothetical protein
MIVNYIMWMLKKVHSRILWMLKYNVELDISNKIYIMGGWKYTSIIKYFIHIYIGRIYKKKVVDNKNLNDGRSRKSQI